MPVEEKINQQSTEERFEH